MRATRSALSRTLCRRDVTNPGGVYECRMPLEVSIVTGEMWTSHYLVLARKPKSDISEQLVSDGKRADLVKWTSPNFDTGFIMMR